MGFAVAGLLIFCSSGMAQQTHLYEALFLASTEGWTVEGTRPGQIIRTVSDTKVVDRSLEGSDLSSDVWYFTSSGNFAGDQKDAYNGEFSFKFSHRRPPGASKLQLNHQTPDVILESECGHALQLYGLIEGAREIPKKYSVSLREDAGWIDTRSRQEPSQLDFLGVLSNLRSIKIRGAFFVGPETSRLSSVQIRKALLLDGSRFYPCCSDKVNGKIEVCSIASNLRRAHERFNCLGSRQYRVNINSIYPRFSRRSGGATVTVKGENFGLTGTHSIVRIAGKEATSCQYPSNEFIAGNAPTLPPLLPAHCSNGVLDLDEDKPDCGGADCPKCVAAALPPHCTNGVLDGDEIAVGTIANTIGVIYDCGGSCLFPKACCDGKKDNDETGVDCGGTYCQPCNPREMPVGTASAIQLVVLASGRCSETGCRCFAEIPNGTYGCVDFLNLFLNVSLNRTNATNANFSFFKSTNASNTTGAAINATNATYIAETSKLVKFVPTNCTNLMYLASSDKVPTSSAFEGKKVLLSGGPGQGQWAIIKEYDPISKMATLQGMWQKSGDFSSDSSSDQVPSWQVGTIQILQAGRGYENGTWIIPRKRFADPSLVQDEAWGTFTVDSKGAVIQVSISNVGHYEIITTPAGQVLSLLSNGDIICLCPKRNSSKYFNFTATLAVHWYTKQMQTPTSETTYMITDARIMTNWNDLHPLPRTPQHTTLICQAPPGEGHNLELSVDSRDESDVATRSNCSTPSSRGFEYGALDFIWSLQASARQSVGIRSLTVTSLDIDQNAGDIYMTGTIVGSCQETTIGCMGFVSALLPFRGLYTAGSFKPLITSPLGAIVSFIVRLDRNGIPMWLTQIDVSDFVGQVQASSLIVDSSSSPPQIRVTGLYSTAQNIRFWNINPATNIPYKVLRSDAQQGAGRCNRAICVDDSCSSYTPTFDNTVCFGVVNSTQYTSCRNKACAYIEGYPSAISTQYDIFVAEISSAGQFSWIKTRITSNFGGATLSGPLLTSGMTPTYAAYANARIQGETYLAFTILAPAASGDLRISLGEAAIELERTGALDIQPFQISIPREIQDDQWAAIAKYSSGGVLWARLIGPLGINGSLSALKGSSRGVFAAGEYTASQSPMSFQSCNFSAFQSIDIEDNVLDRSYDVCFPTGGISAHYTASSWGISRKGQWNDISGNNRHSNNTRGLPFLNNDGGLTYVQGDQADGVRFPHDSLPTSFTICSVSKMLSKSPGSVIDGVGNDKWVHGHFGGSAGFAAYGNNITLTRPSTSISPTEWLVMCGQNRNNASIFNANGALVGQFSGGLGNRTLTINYGYSFRLGLMSQWAVMEIIIWNRLLTKVEIDSVVLYYNQSLQFRLNRSFPTFALPANGAQSGFLFLLSQNGVLMWHKEAVGGNVSIASMDVKSIDFIGKSSYSEDAEDLFEDPNGYVYIVGTVSPPERSDFGVMKYPLTCSEGLVIGMQLTQFGDPFNRSNSVCSGQIVSQRNSINAFVVKYSASSGEPQWIKRLGQLNSNIAVSGIAVDALSQQIFVTGSYSYSQNVTGYHDSFDLVAAGRARALGCPVDPLSSSETDGMILDEMNPDIGKPNCSFTPHTAVANLKAGFLTCLNGYNAAHGGTSRPWSQCLDPSETGCNADGLKWAKMLGSGVMETLSTTAESSAGGVALARFREFLGPVIVFGKFKGFIQGTNTGGLKTPGFDDDGFFNCCRNLGITNLLDEVQDVFESYVMALGE